MVHFGKGSKMRVHFTIVFYPPLCSSSQLLSIVTLYYIVPHFSNIIKHCITNLHKSLQLIELAVKILKVVFVESSEAILVHYFHQHAEGLFLRHLKPHG